MLKHMPTVGVGFFFERFLPLPDTTKDHTLEQLCRESVHSLSLMPGGMPHGESQVSRFYNQKNKEKKAGSGMTNVNISLFKRSLEINQSRLETDAEPLRTKTGRIRMFSGRRNKLCYYETALSLLYKAAPSAFA